ncbi:MAG: DUF87 domain-containing protein [Thermoplasmata archaeon]|nr:DUF87 domain-containing protein [Thermoplasmata archaeon]
MAPFPAFRTPLSASWSFRPRPRRSTGRPEDLTFRSALLDALRSGHGLGVELELSLTSGSEGSLGVRAFGPTTARWFARVASSAYLAHQWVPGPRSDTYLEPAEENWSARRIHAWPETLAVGGTGSVCDLWAAALSAAPRGGHLGLRVKSLPAATPWPWDSPPKSDPPMMVGTDPRRRAHSSPEPRRTSDETAGTRPLFWQLGVDLVARSWSSAGAGSSSLAKALAPATRTTRGNGLVFDPRPSRFRGLWGPRGITLSIEELAAYWPTPGCPVEFEPRRAADTRKLVPFGRTSAGVVVGPRIDPHQGRHTAVLGETGMGKSSLLVAVARRTLRDAGGVVFDPLGETVRSLRTELGTLAGGPAVWLAPDAPGVTLNALEGIACGELDDPVRSERRLNDLVHALRRVRAGRYADSGYWGPRLEEMVTRASRAASGFPNGTLVDAHTLLATGARLGRPVPSAASESVRELADRIRDRPEDADGARRLLHEVVRNPVLLRMLCAPQPTIRTRDLVAPRRVVLVSGDAARVGESTARYLLSVLLALVWSELLARPEPAKTFVILDEAQWFAHDSLAEMLRLGRRKNVHVLLATQSVGSLPDNVREAIWTNVADFVAFRGSPEEAREFSRAAPGAPAESILSLPRGEAAVLLGKGETVRWLRTARLPAAIESSDDEPPEPTSPPGGPSEGTNPSSSSTPVRLNPRGQGALDPSGILDDLVRAAEGTPGDLPYVVELGDLRRRLDPGGSSVRSVGSLLARSHALIRVERTETGPRWVIDRARLSDLGRRPRTVPRADADSTPPQPS